MISEYFLCPAFNSMGIFTWGENGENGENGTKSQKQPFLITFSDENILFFIAAAFWKVKTGENGAKSQKQPFLITFQSKTSLFLRLVFPFSPLAAIFTFFQ